MSENDLKKRNPAKGNPWGTFLPAVTLYWVFFHLVAPALTLRQSAFGLMECLSSSHAAGRSSGAVAPIDKPGAWCDLGRAVQDSDLVANPGRKTSTLACPISEDSSAPTSMLFEEIATSGWRAPGQ
jgi:hypothetical protein